MEEERNRGTIQIADEVVSIIAGLAATEVEGVAGMSSGIAGGIAELLGKKNLSKGVKVEVGDSEAVVDLFVVVDYSISIPDVSWRIQDNVKEAIESMTGLHVVEINVHVQGVHFAEEEEDEKEEQDDNKEENEQTE
ncbi:MAG: Asp23/Gls24 family envelope stress response protein [Halanaerobiales bacterium]